MGIGTGVPGKRRNSKNSNNYTSTSDSTTTSNNTPQNDSKTVVGTISAPQEPTVDASQINDDTNTTNSTISHPVSTKSIKNMNAWGSGKRLSEKLSKKAEEEAQAQAQAQVQGQTVGVSDNAYARRVVAGAQRDNTSTSNASSSVTYFHQPSQRQQKQKNPCATSSRQGTREKDRSCS